MNNQPPIQPLGTLRFRFNDFLFRNRSISWFAWKKLKNDQRINICQKRSNGPKANKSVRPTACQYEHTKQAHFFLLDEPTKSTLIKNMRGNMTNSLPGVKVQRVLFQFVEQWLGQQSLEWRRGIALRSTYVIMRHRYPNLAKSGFTLSLLRRKAGADVESFLQDGQLPEIERLMDVWLKATSFSKRRELPDLDEMRLIVNDFVHVLEGELACYDDTLQ